MTKDFSTPRVFIIEGLDRLGKSTLIEGILDVGGFYQVIHFQKPKLLSAYQESAMSRADALFKYQKRSFETLFKMVNSNGYFIFDRAHLGEFVYSPLYRNYGGDYVFDLEHIFYVDMRADVRLILLTEDLSKSTHFEDDGLSFDITKREQEQQLFLQAFDRSVIRDKRKICVTGADGHFKPKEIILQEALKNK